MTYAIVRYGLMDIRLAITRLTIFTCVYVLVLGVPLYLHYVRHQSNFALWSMLLLATLGPYVYAYLRKEAEKRLSSDQKQYQAILAIKDNKLLSEEVLKIASQKLQPTSLGFYIYQPDTESFALTHAINKNSLWPENISQHDSFCQLMQNQPEAILIDATNQQAADELKIKANEWNIEIISPITHKDKFLGFIILGPKADQQLYTDYDIEVMNSLSVPTALALDNCFFIENEKERIEEQAVAARAESLNAMAGAMAHELLNPVASIRGYIQEFDDILLFKKDAYQINDQLASRMDKTVKAVNEETSRVENIVTALKALSRKEKKFEMINLNELIASCLIVLDPVAKHEQVEFEKEIDPNLPSIWGNKGQLQLILLNFAKNSMHAVKDNASLGKSKWMRLKVCAINSTPHPTFSPEGRSDVSRDSSPSRGSPSASSGLQGQGEGKIIIEFFDNGYGIYPHGYITKVDDVFLPFTTSKGSSESQGLGLNIVKQIVELHGGKVWAESTGKDQGAVMHVEIPLTKGEGQSAKGEV